MHQSFGQAVGARCQQAVGAGVRAWGPCIGPLACMPLSTLHAVGMAGGCQGWGSSRRVEGRPGLGAQPPPAASPLGRQSGSAALLSWAQEVRVSGPVTGSTGRALTNSLRAL